MRRWGWMFAAVGACGFFSADPVPEPSPRATPASAEAALGDTLPTLTPLAPARAEVSPLASPASAEEARVAALLERVVREHGVRTDNPWALVHAMLALGVDLDVGGHPAVDHLFTWAVRRGGGVGFPAFKGGAPVEPHTDLILKALAEGGVDPEQSVQVLGATYPVSILLRSSASRTWTRGPQTSAGSWNDLAWTASALVTWLPPDAAWVADGREMTLAQLVSDLLMVVRGETAFLAAAMAEGETVQKRRQDIFAYTCGGAHLVQAAGQAVARGLGGPDGPKLAEEQAEIQRFRYRIELDAVDAALVQAPQYRLKLLIQRMKFLGHHLETVHRFAAQGFIKPTEAWRTHLNDARGELVRTVDALEALEVYPDPSEVKPRDGQAWLDLIGDAAHALRGLRLSSGDDVVRW